MLKRVAAEFKVTPDEVEAVYLSQFKVLDDQRHKTKTDTTRQKSVRLPGVGTFANKEEYYERNRERHRRRTGKYPEDLWCNNKDQGGIEGIPGSKVP